MKYRLATLLVGLAAVVAPQAASAATFYVDPAGSDANPGTSPLSPWRSVARVNSRVFAPGDSVLFRAGGVWNAMVSVQGGGTAAAPVTVGAYGGGRAIIDGNGATGYSGLEVASGDYVRYQSLEIRNWTGSDENAVFVARGSHLTFDDIDAHDNLNGLFSSGSGAAQTDVQVTNSVFSGVSNAGVALAINNVGSTGWRLSNDEFANAGDSCILDLAGNDVYDHVRVHHCGYDTSIGYGKHGFYMKGPETTFQNGEIFDVYDGSRGGAGGNCISPREGGLIQNNLLHDCKGVIGWYDYTRAASQTLRIRGNRIWGFADWGVYVEGPNGQAGDNPSNVNGHSVTFDVSNNTIVANNAAGAPAPDVAFGSPAAGYSVSANVENNILAGNQGGAPALEVFKSGGNASYSGRHNIFWNAGGATRVNYRGTLYSDPGNVPAETGSDAVNPGLQSVAYSSANLGLQVGSPAIDFGVANPAAGALQATCDGSAASYCGNAPDAGAVETLASAGGSGAAPTVTISSAPVDGPSTSASISFTTTGTVNSTTCSLDGAAASCSSPQSYSGLAAGGHSFKVTVAGNGTTASDTTSWTVGSASGDTSAPGVPGGLAATTAVTSATLTWSAARDDVGVTGYAIYVNGTLATKVSGTTVTLAGLEAHTAYRFQVAAFDAAGNQSAKSARKSVRTHRTGWTSKGSALSLAVSRTAAELHVQHGTTGSLTVDNRASTHVRGRRVRFATLAANRWHRLSGQLRRGTHRTTVAVAFLTHA